MQNKTTFFIPVIAMLLVTFYEPANIYAQTGNKKKIVLIAGAKSHGPGYHEYIKTARLLKMMLDHSNVKNIETSVYENGWPDDPSVLNTANLLLFISDGRDGHLYSDVPFMTPGRMEVMKQQMKRGCGLSLIHFSTFASDSIGSYVLQWGGGYFDWQDERGERNWYSSINNLEAQVEPNKASPLSRGVKPFLLNEEFYYNIRFNEEDRNVVPVLNVPALKGKGAKGNCVAWTIERPEGGRGFSTTMGHYFFNWQNSSFRKFMLNGIVWAAGAEVPASGVESLFYSNREVSQHLYGVGSLALILTGNNHPAHNWRATTPLIKKAIESGASVHADISTNIDDLSQYDLNDYDFLVLNYCNWNDQKGLRDESKNHLAQFLNNGGGLMIIHFANGAFHYSLPGASASDWPEYRNICYRVWDHQSNSGHDAYGSFKVNVTSGSHPITRGVNDFLTTDELYFNQKGREDLAPLFTAYSKITRKQEPLGWAYHYGKGRIFQTLLGHSPESFANKGMCELLHNAAVWLREKEVAQ